MEQRSILALLVLVGVVFLSMHAGHISNLVSGPKNPSPAVQVAVPGLLSSSSSPGSPGTAPGAVQSFILKSVDGQYDPASINVNQGTTVRIEGDPGTLSGCMAVVNIPGYGISKLIQTGDHVIEFTADKTGTFPIYCDMGIGNGRLVVD